MTDPKPSDPKGIIPAIVKVFLGSKFSLILVIIALCLGAAALFVTPKEEEPQIVVPMADIYVNAPGASPQEIEQLVSIPLERFLWQIDGVEYVYSISQKDMAVVTVRFFVGEDREDSLIKLHNRISMHIDQVTPIVEKWVIKPIEIDDVPIVTISLFSDLLDDAQLHRTGQEALARLSRVENVPVLIEDIYLHETLFAKIDSIDLSGRSLSQIVDENYYMRPKGGKQNFRIGYLTGKKAKSLHVAPDTPILTVKRFLHFEQAKNVIYSELYCRTDKFVFSQTLGDYADER